MRNRIAITVMVLLLGFTSCAFSATNEDFKNLGALYAAKDSKESCKQELLAKVSVQDPLVLWEELWKATAPEQIAAISLAIVEVICPDGNLARWNEASGFLVEGEFDGNMIIVPPSVPRQIVILEATLAGISALSETGDLRALWVAKELFFALKESPELSALANISDPEGYRSLYETFATARKMIEINGIRPFPWGDRGNEILPLNLRKLRQYKDSIPFYIANSKKMLMLNHDGQIISGTGEYAWDWKETGFTYSLMDNEIPPEGDGTPGTSGTGGYSPPGTTHP